MSASPFLLDSPKVLAALRARTGQLHTGLEKRMPFFSARLDLDLYTRLIQAYYGFYAPLETELLQSPWVPDDLELAMRRKVPALERDLQALGIEPALHDRLPRCAHLPLLDSQAACMGVLYVLEGATLGGQVLRREMQARLGLDEHSGSAFLDVYGPDTGRRWKAFLGRLDAQPADPAFCEAAAEAAHATFSRFEQWLDHQGVLS